MVFAPVDPKIRASVIEYHLAGFGRNAIDRELRKQGIKVGHTSISNFIKRYKKSLQPVVEQNQDLRKEQSNRVTTFPEQTSEKMGLKREGISIENHLITNADFKKILPEKPSRFSNRKS
jgi:hypothetical protein